MIDKGLVRGHQSAQADQIGIWLVDFYNQVKNNGVLDDVMFSAAQLKAKLEEQKEGIKEWLIYEDFEGLAERL